MVHTRRDRVSWPVFCLRIRRNSATVPCTSYEHCAVRIECGLSHCVSCWLDQTSGDDVFVPVFDLAWQAKGLHAAVLLGHCPVGSCNLALEIQPSSPVLHFEGIIAPFLKYKYSVLEILLKSKFVVPIWFSWSVSDIYFPLSFSLRIRSLWLGVFLSRSPTFNQLDLVVCTTYTSETRDRDSDEGLPSIWEERSRIYQIGLYSNFITAS